MNKGASSLDPVDVARYLAGLMVDPDLASVVGPYSLILVFAVLGAGLKLSDLVMSRWSSFFFMIFASFVSVGLTVPLAAVVASKMDGWEAQWLFIPLSLGLGYLGDKWKSLLQVPYHAGMSWIKAWMSKQGEQK